jgi:hypothetical protein
MSFELTYNQTYALLETLMRFSNMFRTARLFQDTSSKDRIVSPLVSNRTI